MNRERRLFLLAVALEVLFCAWMIGSGRIAWSHDGYMLASFQYWFLGAATDGSSPDWMPFLAHGSVATLPEGLGIGVLQSVLVPLAPLFRGADFLVFFHLGFLVEDLLLLLGIWLLARRYCRSPTAIFLTATTMLASSVWIVQPWLNFRFYFALPLVLELLQRFLDERRARWAFLAANLLAFQLVGNAIYFLPVQALVAAGWVAFQLPFLPERRALARAVLGAGGIAAVGGALLSFLVVRFVSTIGTAGLVLQAGGRNPDGTVPLADFLRYGGDANLERWLGLFSRVSPGLDSTLYLGVLAAPLVVVALADGIRRENVHVPLVAAFVLLFACGGWLAAAAWYAWPLMRVYRHLGMATGLAKPLLCLLVGIGFDCLLVRAAASAPIGVRPTLPALAWIAAAVSAVASAWMFVLSGSRDLSRDIRLTAPLPKFEWTRVDVDLLGHHVGFAAFLFFAATLLFCLLALPWGRRIAPLMLLLLGLGDLGAFRLSHVLRTTRPVTEEGRRELTLRPPAWSMRRCERCGEGPRRALDRPFALPEGARYAAADSLLHEDRLDWSGRLDYWLDPMDDLLRAYGRVPLDDHRQPLPGLVPHLRLDFPGEPSARRIAGGTADKIGVFSAAHPLGDSALAGVLVDPRFQGDLLFVDGDRLDAPMDLAGSERLDVPVTIRDFGSSRLTVDVDTGSTSGAWLYYADTWDPGWTATVNGKPAVVHKAQLAYKAIALEPGANVVSLRFSIPWKVPLRRLIALWALGWLVGAVLLARRCVI